MRKALEFPRIDEGKLDAVEALIAAIADKTKPPARSWRTWPLSRAKSALMWNLRNTGAGRTWTHWHGSHWRRNRPVDGPGPTSH